jgi:predicted dehydrogenase
MLNVGIIGAGAFGRQHARAIAALPDVQVVAASRTNASALQQFVAEFGGQGYTDYNDLIADPAVQAVAIATPHDLHTEIVIKATRAGKHILLEKPIAPTLAECDQIVSAVQASDVTFMAGHTNHFVPVYRQAKAIVDSGELGQLIMGIDKTYKFWMVPNRRPWHLDRRQGGGMWMTIGVHNVDRLTWFAGSRVRAVSAHLGTRYHDQQADDTGMAFLRYENGFAGTVAVAGYSSGAPSFELELMLTGGRLRIDKMSGLQIGRGEKWQDVPLEKVVDGETWMEEALIMEWRAFVDAIDEGSPSPISAEFARHIMAVIFAAERSSREGREVEIEAVEGEA